VGQHVDQLRRPAGIALGLKLENQILYLCGREGQGRQAMTGPVGTMDSVSVEHTGKIRLRCFCV
jgi:hypothetical protein